MQETITMPVTGGSVTVRASINERKFLASMKHLFATSFTVLGELMQNARRAGATRIDFDFDLDKKTAIVRDDGCGIDDFQVVIAMCDSGWQEQVQLTDKPFGMGLFSLFFAADCVVFRSKGRALRVKLDDIVNKRELAVVADPDSATVQGTEIQLIGLKEKMLEVRLYRSPNQSTSQSAVQIEIENRALGFPIRVFVNNVECPRPYAQEALQGENTPIGFVSYQGVTNHAARIPSGHQALHFLQGLPIGKTSVLSPGCIVVHLDSTQFTARMPDRSDLFDAETQLAKVRDVLHNMAIHRLASLKASMDGHTFVQMHWENCSDHDCLELMDDIPWVPESVLYPVNKVSATYEDVWESNFGSVRLKPRSDFISGAIKTWRNVDCSTGDSEGAALTLKLMQEMDIMRLCDDVLESHWLYKMSPSVEDLTFEWEAIDTSGEAQFSTSMGSCTIQLAKAVKVKVCSKVDPSYMLETTFQTGWLLVPKHPEKSAEEDAAAYYQFEFICYVMDGNADSEAVDALSTFTDEYDHYDESYRNDASREWSQLVNALRGVSLSKVVAEVLNDEVFSLGESQLSHLCAVRVVQHRTWSGAMKAPAPDVIDLMNDEFWMKAAQAFGTPGGHDDLVELAKRIRLSFNHAAEPGWQEPVNLNNL